MKTRALTITDGQQLALREMDLYPEPGEVLLKVHDCGICGSDLHALKFPHVFSSGPGFVLGHEFSGEVAEITPEARALTDCRPGDRVVALPSIGCGDCADCLAGLEWRCVTKRGVGLGSVPGAFADYVRAGPRQLFRIPDGLSFRHAALTEPLAVALHGARRARLAPGDPCLIMGAGLIGLFALVWARLAGAEPIVVSDPAPTRREQALALGAHDTVDPQSNDPGARMRQLAGGRWPRVVLECVGTRPTLQEAMRLAARGGRVIVLGISMEPYDLQPMTAHAKELEIHYVFAYSHDEFAEALQALARAAIPAEDLITDVIALDAVPAMFAALAHPTTQVKVLVEPALRA